MAKDPAFLFYSGDFIAGVSEMTMEERGQYITLLCFQHGKGHLSLDFIKRVIPGVSEYVLAKFIQDEEGLYYNERLEYEAEKRRNYSESRRNNRKKKDMLNISETYVTHMENENININDIVISNDSSIVLSNKEQSLQKTSKVKKGKYLSEEAFLERMQKLGKEQVKIGNGLVYLRRSDYDEMLEEFGRTLLHEMINQLDLYKAENDKHCGKELYVKDEVVLRRSWVMNNARQALSVKNSPVIADIRKREAIQKEYEKQYNLYNQQSLQPE